MDEKNIPFIHNYCDRWCERCSFTSRCAVYEDEAQFPEESNDMKNEAFWERLAVNFSKAKEMLEQAASRYGIDLNTIAQEADDYDRQRRMKRREIKEHVLSKLSEDYRVRCMEWLQTQPGMMDKLELLKTELTMGVEGVSDAREKVAMIKDSLEVIQWYETFIHVKLIRALMGRDEAEGEPELDENGEPFASDSDGSAKIALIAMDRSMHAWQRLFELLPDQEDEFLKKLGVLQKLRRITEEEFPKAREFKRPGFDD